MRLSAVVPATDGAVTLDRCLAAILAAEQPPEEIIVVRAPGMPAAIGPGVLSVDSPGFGGPAAARNAGALIATGDALVFVDADVAVRPDAFIRIRAWFDAQAPETVDAEAVGREHLRDTVAALLHSSELISIAVAEGRLGIVGANYRLAEGTAVPSISLGVDSDA